MKFAAQGTCLLFLLSASAQGATEWKSTGAKIDEVIVDTGSPAPSTSLSPLAAKIPFVNFRYPHVDAQQNVTFIADDPLVTSKETSNHGIYRSYADGRFVALVSTQETAVPGSAAKFKFIRGLQMDDRAADFAFTGYGTDGHEGIYLWLDGRLTCLARTHETILSGDRDPIEGVGYPSISEGHVLYSVATTESGHALVDYEMSTGRSRILLRTGGPMPETPVETFRYFSAQNWNDGDQVLFRAARIPNPNDRPSDNPPPEGSYGLYGWVDPAGRTATNFSPASLQRFVDWTTPVPDVPGKFFTRINSAPISGHVTTFVGYAPGFEGVYWMDVRDRKLRSIVDSETAMPGLFEGAFRSFAIFPGVIDHSVVFVGWAENYCGVFLYRTDRDELFLLTDTRSQVEGKPIAGFEMAGHCLVGNRFAVKVSFKDKSQGVYLATIPPSGFNRVTGPAR